MTSKIFQIADDLVSEMAAADPILAVEIGVESVGLTDLSPAGHARRNDLAEAALAKVLAEKPENEDDRIASAVLVERLNTWIASHRERDYESETNVLFSPLHTIRMVFEMIPADTDLEKAAWLDRVGAVPEAIHGWRESLEAGAGTGNTCSRRQAIAVAGQCQNLGSYFLPAAQRLGVNESAAEVAALTFEQIGDWLATEYAPRCREEDAVGIDRYRRHLARWNGAEIDPMELHEWGWAELGRITERMERVADKLQPGIAVADVPALLDSDPKYTIRGEEAILKFLKELTARTTSDMAASHFEIPAEISNCDVRIAPAGSASAPYYMPPSEDLSRPGTTWLPTLGKDEFHIWHLVSTWYHEAVPGHHLQMATTMVRREHLSRFQRTVGWTSGYAEGWALYAERLMDELGYFDDPGLEMGYLSAQALRAARVVVDTGMHLELKVPSGQPGETAGRPIDHDFTVDFLQRRALQDIDHASSETLRYLGVPGQATSYKLGERMILAARESAKAKAGSDFNLRQWHQKLLDCGPVGLDTLADLMG